ncbi:hypothetical protein HYW43_02660, partial [Candidatus Daviesbacteria bacterium]|nr:hypothetical protein [Candidatus Daviesbacteria bacterium]
MAGPAPTETEGKLSTRGEITPQAVNPVVTTDGQHAEAVAEIAKNVREAGFTNPQVSPTAEADQVLAQIQKDTPGVNVVD